MSESRGAIISNYMQWAKTRSHARFDLAASGVRAYPLTQLPVKIEHLEISGPSLYGYEPLQRALAAKCGVEPDSVVAATGASMANHLTMAATLEPGDEVLIEHPAYEPLLSAARYLGAKIRRFERRFENGFAITPSLIESAVSERTRLILITNLHNPSSVLAGEDALRRVGEIARSVGARVLVDEVYLEAMFERAPRPAFHLGNEFIVTNSLTKGYGLSGLRCGWILAEPELARRMWRLNDLFGVTPAHAAERLSVIALANLEQIADRARSLLEKNRALLNDFLDSRDDLEAVRTEFGTTSFPRLKNAEVEKLCALLHEKYETSVVPGKFFEMPEHFRIGICNESDMVAAGLERLGRALDEVAARK